MTAKKINLTVVGSIALDTITTTKASRREVLGGSTTYACAAAALFTRPGMVGVVGEDFPVKHKQKLQRRGIDLAGLQQVPGRTFRWSGVYAADMNNRSTLSTELNVFADFSPQLPDAYQKSRVLFLANIHPDLQLEVLRQVRQPALVAADTMDLWINTAKRNLRRLIGKVHMLLINDSEARALTGCGSLLDAARKINTWGPRYVLIKKGEHGCMLVTKSQLALLPAFPVQKVVDPTGAGDSFAGGMLGYLSTANKIDEATVREAMLYGTVAASFSVESFSLEKLAVLPRSELLRRLRQFRGMLPG
ncbi:MAG: PfkB family carbohydrate kinase [Lentisphaerae bacterium]|nr:PfkB family carbohydrate kinase [Lentisphaerota bacterium]